WRHVVPPSGRQVAQTSQVAGGAPVTQDRLQSGDRREGAVHRDSCLDRVGPGADRHLEAKVDLAPLDRHPLPSEPRRMQVEQQRQRDDRAPGPQDPDHRMKLPLPVSLLVMAPLLAAQQPRVVVDSLPGLRMSWELIEVPGGPVVLDGDTVMVDTFLVGRTEVPWELYDIFYLRLDVPRGARDSVDARLRPSRPYGAPDR